MRFVFTGVRVIPDRYRWDELKKMFREDVNSFEDYQAMKELLLEDKNVRLLWCLDTKTNQTQDLRTSKSS